MLNWHRLISFQLFCWLMIEYSLLDVTTNPSWFYFFSSSQFKSQLPELSHTHFVSSKSIDDDDLFFCCLASKKIESLFAWATMKRTCKKNSSCCAHDIYVFYLLFTFPLSCFTRTPLPLFIRYRLEFMISRMRNAWRLCLLFKLTEFLMNNLPRGSRERETQFRGNVLSLKRFSGR